MALKDKETRAREADMIRAQLNHVGFPAAELQDIEKDLHDFVEQGWGCTRTYRMPHLGVSVLLQLSTRTHSTSYARLRGTAS